MKPQRRRRSSNVDPHRDGETKRRRDEVKKRAFSLRLFVSLSLRLFLLTFICGCDKSKTDEVVLYTSVDEPIAAPIIAAFEKRSGVHVRLVTDTEASKSVGLAERLRAEKANPQADVWWSNELFLTINLADEGLFEPLTSVAAVQADSALPARY